MWIDRLDLETSFTIWLLLVTAASTATLVINSQDNWLVSTLKLPDGYPSATACNFGVDSIQRICGERLHASRIQTDSVAVFVAYAVLDL